MNQQQRAGMADGIGKQLTALIGDRERRFIPLESWQQAWALIERMSMYDYARACRAAEKWGDMFAVWWEIWGEQCAT